MPEDELEDDALRRNGARAALAAVALIAQELSRKKRNWSALRVLAARLLEICDRMERGVELDPEGS